MSETLKRASLREKLLAIADEFEPQVVPVDQRVLQLSTELRAVSDELVILREENKRLRAMIDDKH